jgi:chromosome segregation ATPase
MEYTLLGPLVIIFTCLVVGLGLGALFMHRKLNVEIALLEEDVATAHQRLRELLGQYNVVRSKKDMSNSTLQDDSYKAELHIKDDKIDRLNALTEIYQSDKLNLQKNLETAAAQILILEGRISKNKKIAIARETELTTALACINDQLELIDTLESNSKSESYRKVDTNTEIQELNLSIKARDRSLERKEKRIQELESLLEEDDDGRRLGGGVGNWKRI